MLKVGFGQQNVQDRVGTGPARLTAESLLRHDAFLGNATSEVITQPDDDDGLTLGQTHKTFDTFVSVWSQCSNVSFGKLLPRFNPANAKHKEMLAILSAIGEVIKAEGGQEDSSTEYFGAMLTSLDSSDTEEGLSATLTLLSMVIKTVPEEVLRAKFSVSSKLLLELLSRHGQSGDASVVRALLGCLSILLRVQDRLTWASQSTLHIWDSLMSFVTDPRPKVRKAAHHSVCSVLSTANTADTEAAFHPAAAHTAKFLVDLIEANAGGSDLKAVLHTLLLLKEVLGKFPRGQVKTACETILRVMTLGNAYTVSCGFQALHGLFACRPAAKCLPGDLNAQLITALYDYQPSIDDAQAFVAWLTVQQEAHINLGLQSPTMCLAHLPKMFATATRCWASDRPAVVIAATTALKAVFNEAVKPNIEQFDGNKECAAQIKAIFATIEDGLKYQYREAWAQVLHLLATFFDVTGSRYHALTGTCLASLAKLRGSVNFSLTNELDYVVGKAIRKIGPQLVLEYIPLQITGEEESYDFPRSWLLPVLRENIQNTQLSYFKSYFLPLSIKCKQRAADLNKNGDKIGHKMYEVIVTQIWSLLPGFCNNPSDLKESFKGQDGLAKTLGTHLQDRKELRIYILASIRQLILKNLNNEENKKELSRFAKNYLAILFNIYTTQPVGAEETGQRLSVLETIKLYFQLADPVLVHGMFDKTLEIYRAADDDFLKEACNDLLRALLPYQDMSRLEQMYEMSASQLRSTDHKQQKKAYKMLEEICGSSNSACRQFLSTNLTRVQQVLLQSLSKASPPSQASRLKCLIHIVRNLSDDSSDFVYKIVPEAILCIRATNEKARLGSYTLLVVICEALQRWRKEEPIGNIVKDYMQVMLAGLAGGPTQVHCTLLAITRIFFEFHDIFPEELTELLVDNVCLLVTSQSREVVGSSLSFLRVFVTSYPVLNSAQFCEKIVRGVVKMSDDCKRHYRLKTRYLFDRLVRKFGHDVVQSLVPKDDVMTHKRLKNIRKIQARKKRLDEEKVQEDSDNEDDAEFKVRMKPKTMEEILALSGSDKEDNVDGDDDDDMDVDGAKSKKTVRKKKKQSQSFITEGDTNESIVDFLDASAAQKVSSTRPRSANEVASMKEENNRKGKLGGFEIGEDGRLIIKDDDDDSDEEHRHSKPAGYLLEDSDDENGGNAENTFQNLVSTVALARKRKYGGSVASSKRSGVSEPAMKYQAGGSGIHRQVKKKPQQHGSEYKAAKAKGDVKRKGMPDPYAYVPLQKSAMNRRKRAKFEGQYKGLVKAAERGSQKGKNSKAKLVHKMKGMKV